MLSGGSVPHHVSPGHHGQCHLWSGDIPLLSGANLSPTEVAMACGQCGHLYIRLHCILTDECWYLNIGSCYVSLTVEQIMAQFMVSWGVKCRRWRRHRNKLDVEKEPLLSSSPAEDNSCWRSLFRSTSKTASSSYTIRPYKNSSSTMSKDSLLQREAESDA